MFTQTKASTSLNGPVMNYSRKVKSVDAKSYLSLATVLVLGTDAAPP